MRSMVLVGAIVLASLVPMAAADTSDICTAYDPLTSIFLAVGEDCPEAKEVDDLVRTVDEAAGWVLMWSPSVEPGSSSTTVRMCQGPSYDCPSKSIPVGTGSVGVDVEDGDGVLVVTVCVAGSCREQVFHVAGPCVQTHDKGVRIGQYGPYGGCSWGPDVPVPFWMVPKP